MTVLFSCQVCGLMDVPLKVASRGDQEKAQDWVRQSLLWVARKHLMLKPFCDSHLVSIKIPVPDGVQRIGEYPS